MIPIISILICMHISVLRTRHLLFQREECLYLYVGSRLWRSFKSFVYARALVVALGENVEHMSILLKTWSNHFLTVVSVRDNRILDHVRLCPCQKKKFFGSKLKTLKLSVFVWHTSNAFQNQDGLSQVCRSTGCMISRIATLKGPRDIRTGMNDLHARLPIIIVDVSRSPSKLKHTG